jgi:hypothetical protein
MDFFSALFLLKSPTLEPPCRAMCGRPPTVADGAATPWAGLHAVLLVLGTTGSSLAPFPAPLRMPAGHDRHRKPGQGLDAAHWLPEGIRYCHLKGPRLENRRSPAKGRRRDRSRGTRSGERMS